MIVSVIVITYNSEKYVIETLESIKNQTYEDIEIIVTDDCSTDKTLEICNEWIKKNNDRFISSKVTKTDQNVGICGNCNNGLKNATGEWIKIIAGDDKLRPDCIKKFVQRTALNDDVFLICMAQCFSSSNQNIGSMPKNMSPYYKEFKCKSERIKFQELYLLRKGPDIPGSTVFLHTDTLRHMGGFDEKYPFVEDYPLGMKYLKEGYPVGCVNEILIEYRVYPESVSRANSRTNLKFTESLCDAREDYCIPAAVKHRKAMLWYHYKLKKLFRHKRIPRYFRYVLLCFDWIHLKQKLNR